MELSIDQAFQEGLAAHDEGRLQDAEFIYRAILEVQSAHPDANHNLGVLVVSAGKPIEALPFFTLALEASPGIEQFWLSYVDALLRAEWFEEAKQALADALQSGIPLEKLGVFHEQAAQASPKAHKKARQGLTLSEKRKRLAEKKKNKKKSVRDVSSAVGPSQDQVDLLLSFYQGNRFAEAEELARTLTQRFPSHPFAWKVLGAVLRQIGRQQESLKALQTCADLSPQDPEGRSNLGVILREIGKLDEAEASYRQALSLKPENAEAHNNLGTTLTDLGRLDEAEENLRHAITLKPDYAEARHNLLFVLNYDHRLSAADLYGQYAAYGEAVSELTKHCFAHNERTPIGGRRVRVGYSSPDFRGHACRFFMEPLFRNHDRDQFELFAYSNTLNPDQHTERMKGYFDHWVDVVGMTDEEMAQRIYDDQVDILVDMAGHTKGNRLPVFAMRPAPIQASSCTGYAYTTGLKEVDYFICDENMVPEGSECYFSEEPWRLPAPAEPYDPPREEAPDVSELPALRNGYVTFGSLTRTVRINDPLLRVWSEILERVPNSRLRLDQKPFAHEGMRELFWKRLEGLGLPRDRVDLTCSPSHWTAYHDIDITLDCWPHNAGTTTLESLWMGVPVLSKMDRPSVGRIGAAALKPLGLEDWLVETAEAYVEKAVSFASDLDALSELRAELRDRVDQGPHLDAATITGHLEDAYRQMIRCEGSRGADMQLSIDQAFQEGLAAHDEGRLQDAEFIYRAILEVQSAHPDANHNLGVLVVSAGKPIEALPFFTLALEASPGIEQFWLSYVDALLRAEWFEEAKQALADALQSGIPLEKLGVFHEQAAQASPKAHKKARQGLTLSEKRKRLAEKKKNKKKSVRDVSSAVGPSQDQVDLLLSFYQGNRFAEAEELARTLTQRFPSHPFAWKALGVALDHMGRQQESLKVVQRCVELSPEDAEAHYNLGNTLKALGRLDEAETSYRQAIVLNENFPEAFGNLGNALKELGRLDEAVASLRQAVALKPDYAEAHSNLGVMLKELGRLHDAEAGLKQAIALKPDYAEAHNNLGVTYKEQIRLDEAEASYRQAIALKPDYAEAHSNLGNTLRKLGRLHEAEESLRQALALDPGIADAYNNLAVTLKELGKSDEAEASLRQAIALKRDYVEAYSNLGVTLLDFGRLHEAEEILRNAVALKPGFAEAHVNLGSTLQGLGKLSDAVASCNQAIALRPNCAKAHSNLAVMLGELGKFDEAEASVRQALSLKSDYAEAHNNLGNTLKELGRLDEAEENLRHAITLKPDFAEARHNLLFVLNYDHRLSAADLYGQYAAYGEAVSELTKHCFAHNERTPIGGRRVRVGYSSPDFRGHACRFFMEPLFRNHDRDQFELFAYSNTLNPDQHTERMKGYFDHWVDVVGMTDEEMAQRIYDDQVDILVDMAGHTKGNRLPVFAMRPAPIQASSWIGFGYTTGLKEVDYFICDENMVPVGSECYFSEEPWRLPAPGYAYEPPAEVTPDVSELPALRNGYVTFGSLTRTVRINDPLLRVWSEILERVPNSRLRLDQKPFAHEGTRELFWKRLEGLGLPRDRVDLTCSPSHWTAYHDIDITLDCWPHNAGTTTLESLWMGVPVLSKMDRPSVGRIGAAALKPLGLEDWLVETAEAYVEKAVSFASDLDALSELRAELRDRVDQGPHLDAATITGHLERAYLEMIKALEG